MRNINLKKNKILDFSSILTEKEKKMLKNVGYILLSEDRVQSSSNSQNFHIRKRDDVVFLQLSN